LYHSLRKLTRNGSRILAIAIGESKALHIQDCWQLLASGASDVIHWAVEKSFSAIQAKLTHWREVDDIISSSTLKQKAIGISSIWQNVIRQIVELGCFTDAPILITGDTGTGKELAAKLIHSLDRRPSKGKFIVVDCTTITPELSSSEFFGHERGAFTHAITSRDGAFALADGGTLFLDEVGELPLKLQSELLRVTQEHTYKKIGSNTWHRTEFRLVCATNRNIEKAVDTGSFRRDFYHRIATWSIHLPPLRDRQEDILPLTHFFLGQVFSNGQVPALDPGVRDCLVSREYPGNIRDLRNLVFRIGQRHVGPGRITLGDIPATDRPNFTDSLKNWRDGQFLETIQRALASGADLKTIKGVAADTAYEVALMNTEGNVKQAAARLGVSARAVQDYKKLHKPKISRR